MEGQGVFRMAQFKKLKDYGGVCGYFGHFISPDEGVEMLERFEAELCRAPLH